VVEGLVWYSIDFQAVADQRSMTNRYEMAAEVLEGPLMKAVAGVQILKVKAELVGYFQYRGTSNQRF
jgi:hypothetical protein